MENIENEVSVETPEEVSPEVLYKKLKKGNLTPQNIQLIAGDVKVLEGLVECLKRDDDAKKRLSEQRGKIIDVINEIMKDGKVDPEERKFLETILADANKKIHSEYIIDTVLSAGKYVGCLLLAAFGIKVLKDQNSNKA